MRLRHLDLIRYGRFADRRLDFGEGGGETDVTIVYGENEAGKSTAFAAWLDLLFGMPLQHSYDFEFARKDLMVGATLDTDEGALTLRRTGQRQSSLTDENGRALDERRLALLLFGLDRDAYRTRFSLDDAVLRQGGAEIAQAKGDLGQLLLAGTSGLSGFAEVLAMAEQEVDGFHKHRGRTTMLAQARSRLKEIDAALTGAALDPRRFDDLRNALATAERVLREAEDRRDDTRRLLALREAADQRRQLSRRIEDLQARLASYPDGPDLQKDAETRLTMAIEAAKRAMDARDDAGETIRRAEARLLELVPDPDGLEVADMLADIEVAEFENGDSLIARASTADADIERRRQERDDARRALAGLVAQLAGEAADPERIVLPREVIVGIREAALDVRAAEKSRQDAHARLDDARIDLGEPEEMPEKAEALADALDALPETPEATTLALDRSREEARNAAAGLPPDWRTLADAGLPHEAELRTAERALAVANDVLAAAEDRACAAEETLAARQTERDGEATAGTAITDEEIEETRARRDQLWTVHRGAMADDTADAFADAMRRDDVARDRYARSAEARARLARLDADILELEAEFRRRSADLDTARKAREAPLRSVQDLARRLGLDDGADPAVFAERHSALARALEAALAQRSAAEAARRVEDAWSAALDRVIAAYSSVAGAPPPEGDPVPAALRLRQELDARRTRIASRQKAAELVRRLEVDSAAKDRAAAAALQTYCERVNGTWCETLDAEHFLRIAESLDRAAEHRRDATSLDRRIGLLEAARAAFDARAAALKRRLGLAEERRVDEILRAARTRARNAAETKRQIEDTEKQRCDAETERNRQAAAEAQASEEIAAVFREQRADPGGDPLAMLDDLLERDALRADLARLEDERRRAGDGFDPGALAAEEADADPIRTATMREAVTEAGLARDEALGQRGEARQALDAALRGAGGAEFAQTRAALLEELREAAHRAATTRIGLMAASGALRRLREDRRGPMLKATEKAFERMTGGEWPRLEAQPTGSGERLVGIRDGKPVSADAMSTGTRGQLYLALRVAGHADFAQRYGPLPFLTDDILETFDDDRAAAALSLTAEMGRIGQAIMFTHHRHLVDLGREVIPKLNVLEL